jgi:sulfatase modifying factor 1
MTSLRAIAIASIACLRLEMAAEESETATAMVSIPSGTYIPLYTVDKTPRKVQAFQLDISPVTKSEFLDFVEKNPRWQRSKISRLFADRSYLNDWKSDTDPGPDLGSPVTCVSWFAARAYAKEKGKRLPSVDEWEYVAQADATRSDATADDAYTQRILDWYSARPVNPLPSPATLPKNFYGVRAMHGLIWEWSEDFNNAMVTGESRGDSGLERNLFCAGGALSATDVRNYAAFMRYAFRSSLKGNYTTANLGFRCAAPPLPLKTTP